MRFEVPGSMDGSRVDKVVADVLELSRSMARQLVERGVTLDDTPVSASDRVRAGSWLETPEPGGMASTLEPEAVDFTVAYEDESLLVIDKPAGVVVHPGSGNPRGTLAAGLIHRFPELVGVGAKGRWGLVHRLDKDTSGLLIVARAQESFDALSAALAARRVHRAYTAMVRGTFGIPTGTVDAPIGRDESRPTRRAVVATGKHARTHYEVAEEFGGLDVSLLDIRLETGRTHQIRVHMAAIDHPIVGDRKYGRRQASVDAPRVFLHAGELAFPHPGSGRQVEVQAPLPEDLQGVLDAVRRRSAG